MAPIKGPSVSMIHRVVMVMMMMVVMVVDDHHGLVALFHALFVHAFFHHAGFRIFSAGDRRHCERDGDQSR
jgi:hypothetical protein